MLNPIDLLALRPMLMQRAMRLCGNRDDAEDLVQDAFVLALGAADKFDGKNLAGWLTIILRNKFFQDRRKSWRSVQPDPEGLIFDQLVAPAEAPARIELREAVDYLHDRSPRQGAFIVDCAQGFSYEEIAKRHNAPIGSVRSEIHRARNILAGKPANKAAVAASAAA